ncbi:pyridoxal-phosphate dependent enzyme [Undibacterium sp. RTI2.1]|uniref:1-aminocyclopropane-1-carboxylate deaminase/D-cysteine desulfhydrase n=1 Tax=unclassified Undibacterium TaxID=2630295 RepID=UPI002AB3477B|nr:MULTISPECIES: pyridoxal-phosphate dependent enzyme [unclassified Undibacterium]MDY7539868.1 pyridoxal-phosphate dependent enzyme [Undibacterium sp. 5I1]MEB0029343.1 pyridoxal-phosphate dependent enzyme [Undibacterium sp. RTI2.1]MEB0116039.1 pyridoxal-phosphate dependent enzyme [Undibacterium sp. RTI2.2]MEB0232454.1 pyridoxal-phosphate dependent enzyme [Undibacterium sp. 10I3]MEB0259818.1 pyridoxal-phosphate dependent enzyme [Undibacterium sp. 5I1]
MSALPLFNFPASPCQRLESRFFADLEVWIKRDDLLHQQVSGNKFRKLKYPLQALAGRSPCLVTMGGPWSNHLHATAHAAALLGWRTIGLVRGAPEVQSATLDDCRQLGMHIVCVTREEYRQLRQPDDRWRQHVPAPCFAGADYVWLPEGGSSAAALHGVAELVDEAIDQTRFIPDSIVLACGTGATLAGVLAGLRGRSQAVGIAVLKSADYLHADISRLLQQASYPAHANYQLLTGYHQGGYGKAPPALRQFCSEFSQETGIDIEPVYTGKVFYALMQMAQSGEWRGGRRVLVLHTGGLQGARGFA